MGFDYNTSRFQLSLPEYGRNVHNMVKHAMAIEDKDERNKAAKAIIAVMGNLNPQLRDNTEYTHKLWDHLAIMSDFQIDIDSPYDKPDKEVLNEKPKQVPYDQHNIRYRHYGLITEKLITKAKAETDEEAKKAFIMAIANHMKKQFLTWNKDSVADDVIKNDLKKLSGGELTLADDVQLAETRDLITPNNNTNNNRKKKKKVYKK